MENILKRVKNPYEFHTSRDEAESHPTTALDRLAPYASLTVKIVKGRRLMASDSGMFESGKSDPYAEIFLNDESKAKTGYISATLDPVWKESCTVAIRRPGSILQVQVLDYDMMDDDDLLGFVEFLIADLPPSRPVTGWFILSDPQCLTGSAPDRLATLTEPVKETHGAIYLELTLNITSGDIYDEFSAWCFPAPTFKEFPKPDPGESVKPGKDMKALDAQLLLDTVIEIKECVVDDLVNPFLSAGMYIFAWREPLISFVALVIAMYAVPLIWYLPAGIFIFSGILLIFTMSPTRRTLMAAHPGLVPLNDDGYQLIAALRDTEKMFQFLSRTITALNGKVLDEHILRRFAAFAFHRGDAVTTYVDLKRQLRDSVKEMDGEKQFVEFESSPYPAGFLAAYENSPCEVVKCENPKGPNYRYTVKLAKGIEKTVDGEELEARLDVSWVKNPIVLALIPDATEHEFMKCLPPLLKVRDTVRRGSTIVDDIVCWSNPANTIGVIAACILLGTICGCVACLRLPSFVFWIVNLVKIIYFVAVGAVVVLLFIMNSRFFISLVARLKAHMAFRKHASKNVVAWPFLVRGDHSKEDESCESLPEPSDNGGSCGCWGDRGKPKTS